jgi:hypothetical protein
MRINEQVELIYANGLKWIVFDLAVSENIDGLSNLSRRRHVNRHYLEQTEICLPELDTHPGCILKR